MWGTSADPETSSWRPTGTSQKRRSQGLKARPMFLSKKRSSAVQPITDQRLGYVRRAQPCYLQDHKTHAHTHMPDCRRTQETQTHASLLERRAGPQPLLDLRNAQSRRAVGADGPLDTGKEVHVLQGSSNSGRLSRAVDGVERLRLGCAVRHARDEPAQQQEQSQQRAGSKQLSMRPTWSVTVTSPPHTQAAAQHSIEAVAWLRQAVGHCEASEPSNQVWVPHLICTS